MNDPTRWLADHRARAEAAPRPDDERVFVHAPDCPRPGGEPAWELFDEDYGGWRRGCDWCGGPAQHWWPKTAPRPPEPDEAALGRWEHGRDGHRCPSRRPVVELEFRQDPDDRTRGWWRGECRVCGSVHAFAAEAAAHYEAWEARARGAGEPVPPRPEPARPRGFSLDDL